MIKKSFCITLCLTFLLCLTACGYKDNQPSFDTKAKNGIPTDTLIDENDAYRLELNSKDLGVTLTDKATGQSWSSTAESSSGQQLDELGMPIKQHPQTQSVILVKYLNSETNTEDTLLSYTGAVQNGRVRCGKTKTGLRVEFYFDDADIMIPVDYALTNRGVKISVDPTAIQEGENKVHAVSIAPFFCSSENDLSDSYLFVPSGSGALIEPVTRSQQGASYSEQVYGEDAAIEKKVSVSTEEGVKLPVYGAKTGDKGSVAIIDSGAETAWIDVTAGSSSIGFSAVYATFRLRGYTDHTATLFSNTELENVVHSKLMINKTVSVTFCPLAGEDADYNGMASVYRDYLTEESGLAEDCEDTSLNINIIGGSTVTRSFLGVPYDTTLATTTIKQAQEIVSSLYGKIGSGFSVKLLGYTSGGIDIGKLGGGFETDSELGSEKQLKALADTCIESDSDLYMNFDLVRFSGSGGGFSTAFDAAVNAGEQKAAQYSYDIAVRNQDEASIHYLLSPSLITQAADKLIEKTEKLSLKGYSLDTLSYMSYSDYADKKSSLYYSKSGMTDEAVKAIKTVKKNGKFSANDANAYAAVLADIITDAPTCSSGEYIFKCDIPFYELVFKGRIPLVCDSINLADDPDTMLLKAVESGCGLNYTVIHSWDNDLIDSPYSVFYGSIYSQIEQSLTETVERLSDYRAAVSGVEISKHTILENGLRCTEFENGVRVYVNYTDSALTAPSGQQIESLNYLLTEVNQ